MKRRIFTVLLVLGLCVGTASAQFGFGGIVYDPTNYANAVLRYNQRLDQNANSPNSNAGKDLAERGDSPPALRLKSLEMQELSLSRCRHGS